MKFANIAFFDSLEAIINNKWRWTFSVETSKSHFYFCVMLIKKLYVMHYLQFITEIIYTYLVLEVMKLSKTALSYL